MDVGNISGIIGVIVAIFILQLSRLRSDNHRNMVMINREGYHVLRGESIYKYIRYFTLIAGFGGIGVSIGLMIADFINGVIVLSLAIFFVILSFLFNRLIKDNRIEYNDSEIRQHTIFKKREKIIKWSEIKKIKFNKIGPLLTLSNDKVNIDIDFRFDGVDKLLEFMYQKVNPEELSEINKYLRH